MANTKIGLGSMFLDSSAGDTNVPFDDALWFKSRYTTRFICARLPSLRVRAQEYAISDNSW